MNFNQRVSIGEKLYVKESIAGTSLEKINKKCIRKNGGVNSNPNNLHKPIISQPDE